jgi:two-component system response regulator MprA
VRFEQWKIAVTDNQLNVMKKKILLVDDDRAVRESVSRVLEMENYEVLPAPDGLEALKIVASTPVDLVLLDLNMPQKSGWDTFEQITCDNPLLPVIIITARTGQLFTSLGAGAAALLEKPLDLSALLVAMRNILAEPPEIRLSRMAGHAERFHYVTSR